MRVIVAMSGGVDSSAAAAILKEQGHEVIGISLRLSKVERSTAPGRCCSPEDLDDARAVARVLNIPFYVFEAVDLFEEAVVDPFVSSYLSGETPIPCVECNRSVKFGHLLERARALGGKLATGHYARIEEAPDGTFRLLRGVDAARDQSYFLHHLGQEELSNLLFPVGGLTKAEAREAAERAGLAVAQKPESQDICFIPDGDAAGFVTRNAKKNGRSIPGGTIVSGEGEVLGAHDGVHLFTIGQRKGLGAASSRPTSGGHKLPLYVSELRPERGEVVVGPAASVEKDLFGVRQVAWVAGRPPPATEEVTVRVRHRHEGARCLVDADGDLTTVRALEPVRAPAPGQSAVFYRGEEVLGGGVISRLTRAGAGGYVSVKLPDS